MTKDSIRRLAEAIFSALKGSFAPLSHSHPIASHYADGLLSAGDKLKLDEAIAETQYPELDFSSGNFSYPIQSDQFPVGTIVRNCPTSYGSGAAAPHKDLLIIANQGYILGVNVNNWSDRYIYQTPPRFMPAPAALNSMFDSALRDLGWRYTGHHAHNAATVAADGFMSADDKIKLDNIKFIDNISDSGIDAQSLQRLIDGDTFHPELSGMVSDAEIGTRFRVAANMNPVKIARFNALDSSGHDATVSLFRDPDNGRRWVLGYVAANAPTTQFEELFDGDVYYNHPAFQYTVSLQQSQGEYASAGHSHQVATPDRNGFMSAADKSKLDGLSSGGSSLDPTAVATSTSPGLMSALDKQKLDALEQVSLAPKPTGHRLTLTAEVDSSTKKQTGRLIISGHEDLMAAGQEVYLFRMGTFENRYRTKHAGHYRVSGWRCYNGTSHQIETDGSLLIRLPDSKNSKGATTADVRNIVNVSINGKVGRVAGWGNTHAAVNKPGRMIIDGTETKIQHANRHLAFRAAIAMGPVNPNPDISAMTPEKMTTTLAEFLILVSPNDNTWRLKIL